VLAPALGVAGLAGAFPAIAGQARRWTQRALLGALGYWWLLLAEPLLARRLWLGVHPGTPQATVWHVSLNASAAHVVAPLLGAGALLGALLWASAAALLPWIVRGRNASVDIVAATIWSAAIVAAEPGLGGGVAPHDGAALPRGAILGAVLGGVLAVAARALRGPV
jgi:eukaryotic-like serine/threonine-protein kinase